MEIDVLSVTNEKKGKKKLPVQFSEDIRPDIVKRAVLAVQSHNRQSYGAKPDAGMRASAELSRRRRKYRGSYGHGISRVQRKIMSRAGTRLNWVGAVVPGTVGGRRAHAPKSEKIWWQKINKKERKTAIRSAIAATVDKELVSKRGHKVPDSYPFILDSKIESLDKTKEFSGIMDKIGLTDEMKRASVKKIRAGKGKIRGRKYTKKKGPLVVVSKDCKLMKAASNAAGFDIVEVNKLNAELLAPGASIGRLTLWSEAAIDRLEKERLFCN